MTRQTAQRASELMRKIYWLQKQETNLKAILHKFSIGEQAGSFLKFSITDESLILNDNQRLVEHLIDETVNSIHQIEFELGELN